MADTGLLCTLLNIRSVGDWRGSPSMGAVWETYVFAQLRHRERRAGRTGSLFFWRDRTREAIGPPRISGCGIVCRTPNAFPVSPGVRALPVDSLE